MDWTQVLALMGVNIAMLAIMTTLFVWTIGKIDADVKWKKVAADSPS